MLATLIIGLREGLEAALIVSIIAAFLRKNGKSLAPMWFGVVLAVILSIIVGVSLDYVEKALPQAEQEAMETIIGGIAVFFVTGMIVWMNTHARDIKRQIEAEAAHALGQASAYALASMAFLAVLKEGFETSVFLLATFSAAQSAALAAAGAVIGLLLAVLIGWGIYAGGVRINLGRFFTSTGTFLILVAAGLVVTALRTAHEAGWLNVGQDVVMNLYWLVVPGTVTSALLTGVLGIPADPRTIEVLGWLLYLVPVLLYLYWPASMRPQPATARRMQWGVALVFALVALGLAIFNPRPELQVPSRVPLVAQAASAGAPAVGTAHLVRAAGDTRRLVVQLTGGHAFSINLAADQASAEQYNGVATRHWSVSSSSVPANAPTQLTVDQLVSLSGGRVPIGLNPAAHPGPYQAAWQSVTQTTAWVAGNTLLDAKSQVQTLVTLSGGGLTSSRTQLVSAPDAGAAAWQVAPAYHDEALSQLNALNIAQTNWTFWSRMLPLVLLVGMLMLAWRAWANGRRRVPAPASATRKAAENSV